MELPFGMSEGVLRLAAFASVFVVVAMLEQLLPRRNPTVSKAWRWTTNLAFAGLGSIAVRLLGQLAQLIAVPLVATAAAIVAARSSIGFFNWTAWPEAIEIALAVIVLDAAIYLQHVASHKIPLLWRLHRVHHADVDLDLTSGVRFHPVEIALSMLYKVVLVLLLGPAALAVVIFEIVLNGSAMFNHANLRLPLWLDRVLRLVVVTPDMHRIHHSVLRKEHDTNYGFNLSVWDRLLGTYTVEPQQGHLGMKIGLDEFPAPAPSRLWWSLKLPFVKQGSRE